MIGLPSSSRVHDWGLVTILLGGWLTAGALDARTLIEAPALAERVAAGELPPVASRLPAEPAIERFEAPGTAPGRHGGEIRTLASRGKDVRLLVVYGYARLVAYDRDYQLAPDILASIDVVEERQFTLELRSGHRWSDGHPFTAEDFRYFWEDIAGNEELSPFGLPSVLMVDGEPPRFEVIDETTIRYTWSKPNPFFLPALAAARPETIYAPAHYLKQFHEKYAGREKLDKMAKKARRRNWVALHFDRFRPYRNTNPDLPSLQPWVNTTSPGAQRFVFERNPYYHRIDPEGRQLPYIDRVLMTLVDAKLIPVKTGAGDSDLQARGLKFSDYPYLKQGEKRFPLRIALWDTTKGAHLALYPNLNVSDPGWGALLRDVRFRRALSLATDREEINQVFFYGLVRSGNDTVGPASPLFEPRFRDAWASFDLAKANHLLDQMGLVERDGRGIRRMADGRPIEIIVETAGEDSQEADVLQLIATTWQEVGVKLYVKPLQREIFRNRIYAGKTIMSIWGGLENGLPTADMSPGELAPTRQDQYQWPRWGQFHESGGALGDPVDHPQAKELARLNERWIATPDTVEREAIWRQMLEIRADQAFTIGIVAGVPQPVVWNRRLRNVPDNGIYNWDPGAHFGIHRPDAFWFDRE